MTARIGCLSISSLSRPPASGFRVECRATCHYVAIASEFARPHPTARLGAPDALPSGTPNARARYGFGTCVTNCDATDTRGAGGTRVQAISNAMMRNITVR